jgi:hypothetical protein
MGTLADAVMTVSGRVKTLVIDGRDVSARESETIQEGNAWFSLMHL